MLVFLSLNITSDEIKINSCTNYNIDYNYWHDEQEQERWRVGFSENFILTMESITWIDGNTSWG